MPIGERQMLGDVRESKNTLRSTTINRSNVTRSDEPELGGVFPACMTMFNETGAIDEAGTVRHADYLIRCGAHGLVACGTSGEFIAMSNDERLAVIKLIIEVADGKVPVYAGTGHYATRQTIELTQSAEAMGAAGAIVIPPYYQKPPKAAILDHYRTLRRETALPIMIYNNPAYAGCVEIGPWDVKVLVEEGVVQSIKSTVANVAVVHDLLYLCGDKLRVFYGSFQAPTEAMLMGAHGWISGFLNLMTRECVALFEACESGNLTQAKALWKRLLPLKHLIAYEQLGPVNDLAIYRAGLEMIGEHGGCSRPPLQPLQSHQRESLAKLLKAEGFL